MWFSGLGVDSREANNQYLFCNQLESVFLGEEGLIRDHPAFGCALIVYGEHMETTCRFSET